MKIYIQKITGMDIYYDNISKELVLNGKPLNSSIRFLKEMKDVIHDKEWFSTVKPDRKMYYMFRDIHEDADREAAEDNNLRYDITVIPPDMIGDEYVKTQGHCHPCVTGTDVTYPEMYQVLNGEAMFIFEKKEGKETKTYHIHGKEGDIVILPPGYSHVTVNPTDQILIVANWTESRFKSDYRPMLKTRGLAYYYIRKGNESAFISNINNKDASSLEEIRPIDPELIGLKKDEPMYALIKTPEKLAFLTKPQDYGTFFSKVLER
ncbi:MAG: glucose-6-phosphate isomerase [Candidatus Aenigmarchaeota archaeon]|nr:glucose-6-phosphate isomerase [Candidatus Aenigmarchaeota archaeon]